MNYNPIILACPCGLERETDLPVDLASAWPCPRCGATSWTQKQMKKILKKDATAPLEILGQKEEN